MNRREFLSPLREAVEVGKELLIDEVVEIVAGLGGVVVELAVLALRAAQLSQRYGLSRIKVYFFPSSSASVALSCSSPSRYFRRR